MVRHISTGSRFEELMGYSRAVVDGDWIHVSGTTGYDYASMTLPAGARAQAAQAMATIGKVLAEAGGSMADIVRIRFYVAERADVPEVFAGLPEQFRSVRPAATMVLAEMIEADMKVEIEVTARIGAAGS